MKISTYSCLAMAGAGLSLIGGAVAIEVGLGDPFDPVALAAGLMCAAAGCLMLACWTIHGDQKGESVSPSAGSGSHQADLTEAKTLPSEPDMSVIEHASTHHRPAEAQKGLSTLAPVTHFPDIGKWG